MRSLVPVPPPWVARAPSSWWSFDLLASGVAVELAASVPLAAALQRMHAPSYRRMLFLCLAGRLSPAAALLGASTQMDVAAQVVELLKPAISFALDDASAAAGEPEPAQESWQAVAQKAAGLHQLECSPTLVDSAERLVDEAEAGDALAMAGLGTIYLFGQDCLRKRNLTWGFHWLSRAAQLGQPDALATMGFLHASDALRDLYNFTGLDANRTHARVLFERAATGGSMYAQMALGYRFANGVGVRESCPTGAE
eukprot:6015080-Prymnesium_polylepis.1